MTVSQIPWERITSRNSSLGEGLIVARALPSRGRRMVGAWCFLDHLGPAAFAPDTGLHIGAHPHTRLQTFTWMIEGELLHRDSLGSEQVIRPGQVNLMTAGYGISHSEDSLHDGTRLHAAQMWIALPDAVAEQPPAFAHYPQLPVWQAQGCQWSLMAGDYGGHHAPTALHSPLLGLELLAGAQGATVTLQLNPAFEYGVMALEGSWQAQGEHWAMDELAYTATGHLACTLELAPGARLLVLGGVPHREPVVLWWNFVGKDLASIRPYVEAWNQASARFGSVAGSEHRRLPAPEMSGLPTRPIHVNRSHLG